EVGEEFVEVTGRFSLIAPQIPSARCTGDLSY
ncbi:MAG: hypothetical protein ACI9BK_001334, partial [Acidimicrobiales bacterium]